MRRNSSGDWRAFCAKTLADTINKTIGTANFLKDVIAFLALFGRPAKHFRNYGDNPHEISHREDDGLVHQLTRSYLKASCAATKRPLLENGEGVTIRRQVVHIAEPAS
jgi:hypothetical protein